MKLIPTKLFQFILVLIGIGAVFFLLWEPHLEGRNRDASIFDIYFRDPFLAYVYLASIPFFVALYFGQKLLGYLENDHIFTQDAISALRIIRFCGFALFGFVVIGEIFILMSESDDRAGGVFMGCLIGLGSTAMAAIAAIFERKLQKTTRERSGSELPV